MNKSDINKIILEAKEQSIIIQKYLEEQQNILCDLTNEQQHENPTITYIEYQIVSEKYNKLIDQLPIELQYKIRPKQINVGSKRNYHNLE